VEALYVATPMLAAVGLVAFLVAKVWRRGGPVPLGELGVCYASAIFLYIIVPLGGYLLDGMHYTDVNDFRLHRHQPTPMEVAEIGWLYVIYFAAFVISYLRFRRGAEPRGWASEDARPAPISGRRVIVAVLVFLVLKAYLYFVQSYYNLSYTTYEEKLVIYRHLPLVLNQFTSLVSILATYTGIILIGVLFTNYRRYRLYILALVLFLVIPTVMVGHDRGPAVVVVLATFFYYHLMVRPVRLPVALAAMASVLIGFLFMGYIRSNFEGSGRSLQDRMTVASTLTHSNEFEACFATSYEVHRYAEEGKLPHPPWQVYASDFIALFPKQVLPFEKTDATKWYLDSFYPGLSDKNMSWGFGVIAESSIGLGIPELMFKGALIGFLFAQLHRLFCRRGNVFWIWALYIFVDVTCFRTLRASTFELLRSSLFYLAPALVLIQWFVVRRARMSSE
jgi:hypothetical protein